MVVHELARKLTNRSIDSLEVQFANFIVVVGLPLR